MILVVGLSPVWQRTLTFERVVPGRVNRAKHVSETASGKGANVANIIRQLGAPVRLLTIAGGYRGRLLTNSLREKGIPATVIPVRGETRVCQTLLSAEPTTELVEETPRIAASELAAVRRAFARELRRAKAVAFCGTVPAGGGDDCYARLARQAKVPVFVDAQRQQLLHVLAARPLVVKINRDELLAATGSADLRALHERGAQWVVITHGAESVQVSDGAIVTTLQPPVIKAVNPIGSGDAMLAGIAVGVLRGSPMLDAVRFGIACGAANALTAEPGSLRRRDVTRLLG